MFDLQGKNVVVTGAANGIGANVFYELMIIGAYPIGIDIKPFEESELSELREYLIGKGDFHQADAADEEAVKEILKKYPRISGLVNNAGLLGSDNVHGGRNLQSWNKMMRAHALTNFVTTEACVPKMPPGSVIVNLSSIEAHMCSKDVVLYTAAKGAVAGLTMGYAVTLGEKGIRVNSVSPGYVSTKRNNAQYKGHEDIIEHTAKRAPLGRVVQPSEVANLILFLLSDKSSAITGQDFLIDCGYTKNFWDPTWTKGDIGDIYQPIE